MLTEIYHGPPVPPEYAGKPVRCRPLMRGDRVVGLIYRRDDGVMGPEDWSRRAHVLRPALSCECSRCTGLSDLWGQVAWE